MHTTIIEIPATDMRATRHIINVQSDIIVTVIGLGTADYKITVEPGHNWNRDQSPQELLQATCPMPEGGYDIETFGHAAVWFEPVTIGHAVWDWVMNQ